MPRPARGGGRGRRAWSLGCAATLLGAEAGLLEHPAVSLYATKVADAVTRSVGLAGKCGVTVSSGDEGHGPGFVPSMLRSGAARGLAWQTDWGAGGPQPGFSGDDYQQVRLVPQFWGATDQQFVPVQGPIMPVMLGFNEPDQKDMGGSDMDVNHAMQYWMLLVQKARRKGYTTFVAPSIAQALPSRYTLRGDGSEWLPNFLGACLGMRGCPETINFLGFHLYEPRCPTDVAQVQEWTMDVRVGSLKRLMAEFNAKGMNIRGLWLTEFAGRSDAEGLCRTRAQQRAWMEVVLPMLNAEPAVVAYSWFSYGEGRSPYFPDNANLWDYGTGELNELGEAYFRLCSAGGGPGPVPHGPTRSIFLLCVVGLLLAVLAAVACCRVNCSSGSSSDDALSPCNRFLGVEGGNGQPRSPAQALRAMPPALAGSIEACCVLVADRRRFVNESEAVFAGLRRGLMGMPRDGDRRAAPGSPTLGDVPAKAQVWDFLLSVGEQRRFYRAQVKEVVARLEESMPWAQALACDAGLRSRRAALGR